jgi:hypothetical protein
VVVIFSLSSHPIITIIMAWTVWIGVLGRAGDGRWQVGPDGG